MNEVGYFEVLSEGENISGYVSFWQRGKSYFRQSIGLTDEIRCTKAVYDRAKRVFEKQKNGDYTDRI